MARFDKTEVIPLKIKHDQDNIASNLSQNSKLNTCNNGLGSGHYKRGATGPRADEGGLTLEPGSLERRRARLGTTEIRTGRSRGTQTRHWWSWSCAGWRGDQEAQRLSTSRRGLTVFHR